MNKLITGAVVSGVIALVVSFAVVYVAKPAPVQQPLGALAGPDIPSPYLRWGDVLVYQAHRSMVAATTTLCALQSPAATSTLAWAGWSITTGTSTAATIDIGSGATAYATTTNYVSATSVSSGAQGAASWGQPTGTTGILAPNTYVLVKTAGAGLGGYTYAGTCGATFVVN